jgi:PAS domain S-box-containing protein
MKRDRTVHVDFHFHSSFSDGYFVPEILAEKLADLDISYASLTDHDTLAGQEAFRKAALKNGIVPIPGVEIFANHLDKEIHLLAYGFDLENEEITGLFGKSKSVKEVVDTIHSAGGKVFLAHPLIITEDEEELEKVIKEFSSLGLDGLETWYKGYSERQQVLLYRICLKYNLIPCAGSDFHGPGLPGPMIPGIKIPHSSWKLFRNTLAAELNNGKMQEDLPQPKPARLNWPSFLLRIVLPSSITILLFLAALFFFLIPTVEKSLLDRKKETIRELTNSAWSILDDYESEAAAGKMTRARAQENAIERIKHLRYGTEGKDYFWLTDMYPRMIMHPYREDLNGSDLTEFADPDGVKLFVESVKLVENSDHGYLDYVWQWKDDPDRLAPKESYVRRFQPWGWIIGTGIYIEDVQNEINAITGNLVSMSVIITIAIGVLLLFITQQSLKLERQRGEAERELRKSHDKYRTLVEMATEGTLMVFGRRCAYANRTMQEMAGYTENELNLHEVDELFHATEKGQKDISALLADIQSGEENQLQFEAVLVKKDGSTEDVLLTPTLISFAGKDGVIINVRDIGQHKEMEQELGASRDRFDALTRNLNTGVFRVAMDNKASFVEMNTAAREIIEVEKENIKATGLGDLLADAEAFEKLLKTIEKDGQIKDAIFQLTTTSGSLKTVAISLVLIRDKGGSPSYCDGILEDVSERRKIETQREDLLSQLQTSMLFLNEPVSNSMAKFISCTMNTPISRAADIMTRNDFSAIAITTEEGEVVGLVSDHDLRERVVQASLDTQRPVYEIMSSPVIFISDTAMIYEALLLMREKRARHLVVRNSDDKVVGMIRNLELVRIHHYSAAVLSREIQRANSLDAIVDSHRRLAPVVSSLVSAGAKPVNIGRTISAVSDSIVERVINLAMEDLGLPPADFTFLVMGSQGREEQTLFTDQDNAIIYSQPEEENPIKVKDYFLKLSERICNDLHIAGFNLCTGNMMASNPDLNLSLDEWKKSFTQWISVPESQELLQFNILFDFRGAFGDEKLPQLLKSHINQVLENNPAFFLHLARNTLKYRPPLGMMGQIVTGSSSATPHTFNIKEAMLPIVNFARLYALKHGIDEVNTIRRLDELKHVGELREDNHKVLVQAYNYMMEMRYKHQTMRINDGHSPDNSINPKKLTEIELGMIKEAFSQINMIQKKVSFDFLGSG